MATSVFVLAQLSILALLIWKKPRLVLRACSVLERITTAIHPDVSLHVSVRGALRGAKTRKNPKVGRTGRSGAIDNKWRELVAPTDEVECDLVTALTQLGCRQSLAQRVVAEAIEKADLDGQAQTFELLFPRCVANATAAAKGA